MNKLKFKQSESDKTLWECELGKNYSCTIRFYDCGKKYIGRFTKNLPLGCFYEEYRTQYNFIEETTKACDTALEASLELEKFIALEIKDLSEKIKELK